MDKKTKIISILLALGLIAAGAYIFFLNEKRPDKDNAGKIVAIRYLSSSAVVEPYEFANELGYLEGMNIIRLGSNT